MGIFRALKGLFSDVESINPVEKFHVQFSQLNTFLDWQESAVKKIDNLVAFDSPLTKLRYFNFAMGAIDRLANSLNKGGLSQEFFEAAALSLAINLFQDLDEGSRCLDSYGISTDKDVIMSNSLWL